MQFFPLFDVFTFSLLNPLDKSMKLLFKKDSVSLSVASLYKLIILGNMFLASVNFQNIEYLLIFYASIRNIIQNTIG